MITACPEWPRTSPPSDHLPVTDYRIIAHPDGFADIPSLKAFAASVGADVETDAAIPPERLYVSDGGTLRVLD